MATISVKSRLVAFKCKKLYSFNDIVKNLQKVDKSSFYSPLQHVCSASVETKMAELLYPYTFLLKKNYNSKSIISLTI